jgi:hypothetical protein
MEILIDNKRRKTNEFEKVQDIHYDFWAIDDSHIYWLSPTIDPTFIYCQKMFLFRIVVICSQWKR